MSTKQSERTVLSWDDWSKKQTQMISIQGKTVVIQELDGNEYDQIKNIPKPLPPSKFKTGTDGKPVIVDGVPQKEPDYDDPNYLEAEKKAEKIRILKILEYGLKEPNGKSIQGTTDQEKLSFLNKGSAGFADRVAVEILRLSSLLPGDVDFLETS